MPTSGELHCQLCGIVVKHNERSNVIKHRNSAKYQKAVTLRAPKQTLISNCSPPQEDFIKRVTSAFLGADIPLHKLCNPSIKDLFEYMGHRPSSVTSCGARVASLAEEEFSRITSLLVGKNIFVVIDEAEISGPKFINTLVGDITNPATVYLVSCKVRTYLVVDKSYAVHGNFLVYNISTY